MRRRDFIAGIALATAVRDADAQQKAKVYRIAMLSSISLLRARSLWDEFKRNGYVEGADLLVDPRGVGVPITRFDAVAAELVKTAPDVILTQGPAAGRAAQHATQSIPIVALADDPVESGLVASMSQPGGNTTGVGIFAAQLDAKRLEILHELLPSARRIGVLADPTQLGRGQVEAAGRNLGLELITREARSTDDIVQQIDGLAAAQVTAINVLASAVFFEARMLIIERTRALGLPTIYWWPDLAREGGLIGFGPDLDEVNRLLAQQILRILNGAAPAKLPIVQPTRFELVINLKTAKAMGVTVPPSLLARADELIE